MIRQSLLLSYATRGNYTPETMIYGVHHIGVQLVELVEDTSEKYAGKDKYHRTGLIDMCKGSC